MLFDNKNISSKMVSQANEIFLEKKKRPRAQNTRLLSLSKSEQQAMKVGKLKTRNQSNNVDLVSNKDND